MFILTKSNMRKIKLFLGFLGMLLSVTMALAQQVKPLFQSDTLLHITLKLPVKDISKDVEERAYREGELSYKRANGTTFTQTIKIKLRGKNRAKMCSFPPLKINLKKSKLANTVFDGQDKLKLVTHCTSRPNADQLLIKEYLAYKLYQQVSPYSFRVRLCKITYINTSKNNEASTHFGFFIEDIDDVAARNQMAVFEGSIANQDACVQTELDKMTFFQFMIGNLDWSVPNRHNIKLIAAPGSSPVPVPYDFDFAGFVGSPDATPPEQFDLPSVKARYFMGFCRISGGYNPVIKYYQAKQQNLIEVVKNNPYLEEKPKAIAIKYLNGFFDILKDPKALETKIIRACRVNHTHIYQYE